MSVAVAVMLCTPLQAQKRYKLEYGGGLGFSNYVGDIGGGAGAARPFIMDMKLAKTRWNPTGYFRYKFHQRLAVKVAANYLRIAGDDKLSSNPGRKYRNLSFRNDIFDMESTLQLMVYDPVKPTGIYSRSNVFFSAYLFAGVGVYRHTPKALYQGDWVNLRRLKTEGQLTPYKAVGVCIPLGVGFYFTVSKRMKAHRIGIELNWRYTTTDYLDDVSGSGDNQGWLPSGKFASATAAALNNRNPELGNDQPKGWAGNYGWHDNGDGGNLNKAPRGNPNNKDSFMTLTFTYGVAIKSHYTKSRSKHRVIRF